MEKPPVRKDDAQCQTLCDLKKSYAYMFAETNIGYDFYRGWLPDFVVACHAIDRLLGNNKQGFFFRQIKEKYGWARYYWRTDDVSPQRLSLVVDQRVYEQSVGLADSDAIIQEIGQVLLATEKASMHQCILCSSPGEVHSFDGWLAVSCAQHAPEFLSRSDLMSGALLRR